MVYVAKKHGPDGESEIIAISHSVQGAKDAWKEIHPEAAFDDCGCPISVYESDSKNKEIGYISAFWVRP